MTTDNQTPQLTPAETIEVFATHEASQFTPQDQGFSLVPVSIEDWFVRRPDDKSRFLIPTRMDVVNTRPSRAAVFQVVSPRLNPEAKVFVCVREEGYQGEEYRSITVYDNMIDTKADQRVGTRIVEASDAKWTRDTTYRYKGFLHQHNDTIAIGLQRLVGRYLIDPLFAVPAPRV